MRILIIGGTGFIGLNVIRALHTHKLALLTRGNTQADTQDHMQDVHWLKGDRLRLNDLRDQIAAFMPDVVLDMIPQNGTDALAVVDALAGLTGRLVVISSASVYRSFGRLLGSEPGAVDNTPAAESAALRTQRFPYRGTQLRAVDDPQRWLDDYDKILVEEAVLSHPVLQANVVRLPMVYGPGDPDRRVAGYLTQMGDNAEEILLRESAARWRNSRGYVENIGDAIARVVVDGRAGRIYNVADNKHFTEAEWIQRIGDQINWGGCVRAIPDTSSEGHPNTHDLHAKANFAQHLVMDDTRIRKELGYKERVSLKEGLRRTIEDARRNRM